MSQTIVPAIDAEALKKEILPQIEKAKTLVVSNEEEHGAALAYIKGLAAAKKFVTAVYAGPKAILDKAHKDMVADEKKWTDPLEEAKKTASKKVLDYEDAARKKAEEEEARRREAARKLEEEVKLAQAEQAAKAGNKAEAEAILSEEIVVPSVKVPTGLARGGGGFSRPTYYRAKVTNLLELVRYVAANPSEIALLEPAQSALDARAKSMKDGFKLPGCELDKEVGLSVRSA